MRPSGRVYTFLKSELETLQAQPFSDDNLRTQLHVKVDLELLLAREEMFYHQRSRIRWLNFGDKNTNFFHASMIQRRQRNQILQLQTEDGTWLSSNTEINHHMHGFFTNLFANVG
ncbi:hypothetical protein ACSBR1_022135 [Camellia fascicularis]